MRKKETIPLTEKEKKRHCRQKNVILAKNKKIKKISTDDENIKYHKLRDHCHYTGKYRGAANDICNLTHKTPKEIPIVFHDGSTYDYHFLIEELAK